MRLQNNLSSSRRIQTNIKLTSLLKNDLKKPVIRFRFEKFDLKAENYGKFNPYTIPKNLIGNLTADLPNGFRFSQVLDSMVYYCEANPEHQVGIVFEPANIKDDNVYLIPIAVQYNPYDWTDIKVNGQKDPTKKSIFEFLNSIYLNDLKSGKAILMIDQSVEGYGTSWLWDWFHQKCIEYNINPQSIIYLTGDQSCEDSYNEWCNLNLPLQKIKVISSTSLRMYVHKHFRKYIKSVNFDTLLDYKKKNKKQIYLYDCTNMRPRVHRIYNFLHLFESNLLEKGNVSMPSIDEWKNYIDTSSTEKMSRFGVSKNIFEKIPNDLTPKIAKYNFDRPLTHYYQYVERILDDMYKNSWFSYITESSYFAYEKNVFISEKTFKPISCMQPFIICGSRHTLKYLQRIGYKTFHPFIDESYDDAPDHKRFISLMETIKKIDAIKDKVSWMKSMQPILEHNYNKFVEIDKTKSYEQQQIEQYYFDYVRNRNV